MKAPIKHHVCTALERLQRRSAGSAASVFTFKESTFWLLICQHPITTGSAFKGGDAHVTPLVDSLRGYRYRREPPSPDGTWHPTPPDGVFGCV